MQLVQMKALECSNKPLLFLSLSTDPICWHRNCSHIHARERKIQLRKSLSSFRVCLNCRAGPVLQSYMSGAVNTSAAWTCLQVHGQQWASCWSAVKRPTKGKFVTRRACTYLIISATSLTLLPRYATGRTVNFPTVNFPLLLSHNHCVPHSLWSFVQEMMEEKKPFSGEHSLHKFM